MQPGSHLSIGHPTTNSYDMFLQWIIASKPILAAYDSTFRWLNLNVWRTCRYIFHTWSKCQVRWCFVPIFVFFGKSFDPIRSHLRHEVYMSVLDRRSTALFRQLSTMVGMVKDRVTVTPRLLWVKWGCLCLKPSWRSCLFYEVKIVISQRNMWYSYIVWFHSIIVTWAMKKQSGRLGYLGVIY